jgi:hypothetical protein
VPHTRAGYAQYKQLLATEPTVRPARVPTQVPTLATEVETDSNVEALIDNAVTVGCWMTTHAYVFTRSASLVQEPSCDPSCSLHFGHSFRMWRS